jgi:hypothetical protein
MLVLACDFDNLTPNLVETIGKKRLKGGLMNREEEDDFIAPTGEVVGWIEVNLWTNYGWCRCHVLLPWIDITFIAIYLSADKLMHWYGRSVGITMNDTTFILIGQLQ